MPRTRVNTEAWPIVVYSFEGLMSDGEFDEYLRALAEPLRREEPVVYILDATRAGVTPLGQRRRQALWIRQNSTLLVRYSLGTAFVFASPVFRFILSAIMLMQPMPTPHTICGTMDEALRWARERLKEEGLRRSRPPERAG